MNTIDVVLTKIDLYINLGLMALKSCVEALVSKSKYIPYSDSKLTMMLSTALGGNSKTYVIIEYNPRLSRSLVYIG